MFYNRTNVLKINLSQETIMEKRPIVNIEIPTKNRPKSAEFFTSLFDWGHLQHFDDMNYSTLASGNVGVGLSNAEQAQIGKVVVYALSPNIEDDLKKIEDLGGKTVMPRVDIPNMAFALFSDLTGNTLGLVEWTAPMEGEPPTAGKSFVHWEIAAKESQKDAEFYQKLFGWDFQHTTDPIPYTSFSTGNVGGGYAPLDEMYKPGDVIMYIGSDDLEGDVKKVEAAGGKGLGDVMQVPGHGALVYWADPEGNRFAFWKDAAS